MRVLVNSCIRKTHIYKQALLTVKFNNVLMQQTLYIIIGNLSREWIKSQLSLHQPHCTKCKTPKAKFSKSVILFCLSRLLMNCCLVEIIYIGGLSLVPGFLSPLSWPLTLSLFSSSLLSVMFLFFIPLTCVVSSQA